MDLSLPDVLTSVPVLAAIGAAVLVVVVALVMFLVRRRRARSTTQREGAIHPAEVRLHPVRGEVADQLRARWATLQGDFVDAPTDTLHRADAMVAEAMRARGYPATDADGRRQLLAEHEPAHARGYQQLRDAMDGSQDLTTEDRRQVLLHTRTLFDALLKDGYENQPRLFAA